MVKHSSVRQWHSLAHRGYASSGRMTTGLRMRPHFVMAGASRSGTTTLFRALASHPDVVRPVGRKGVRYFDLNFDRPTSWYFGHFPVIRPSWTAHGRGSCRGGRVTFEASGYYMFHPFAMARLAELLPDVRVVVMLRDPVERAYSGWKHERSRGYERESFERALSLEDERLIGEEERMGLDPTYTSFSHHHLAHRARGEYVGQLERIYRVFPRDQVHVILSEEFFASPRDEFLRLTSFLGLRAWTPASFLQRNAEPSEPMRNELRRNLQVHYQPYNRALEHLLHRRVDWQGDSPRRSG